MEGFLSTALSKERSRAAPAAEGAATGEATKTQDTTLPALPPMTRNDRFEALRFAFLSVLIHLAKLILVSEGAGLSRMAKLFKPNALWDKTNSLRELLKEDINEHERRLGALHYYFLSVSSDAILYRR